MPNQKPALFQVSSLKILLFTFAFRFIIGCKYATRSSLLFTLYFLPVMRVMTGSRLLSQDGLLRFFLAFSVFTLALICSPAQAEWSGMGPGGGGGMHNSAISPVDSDIMTVNCDMGGYYVTNDAGTTWRTIDFGGMTYSTAFHPTDKNTFYACARYVYRTTDGGVTWSAFTNSTAQGGSYYPIMMAVDPENSSFMFLTSGYFWVQERDNEFNNAKYTTNGGSTWNSSTGLTSDTTIISIFIDQDGSSSTRNIYVATTNGLFKSTNNGATFSSANTGLSGTEIYDMSGGSDGTLTTIYMSIVGGSSYSLYRSTNNAANWTRLTSGLPSNWPFDVKTSNDSPQTIYYTDGTNIYKSINSGTSWSTVMNGNTHTNVTDGWVGETGTFTFGWAIPFDHRYHCLSICPSDSTKVAWTDDGRFTRSENGGTTWTARYSNDEGSDQWSTTGLNVTTTYDVCFDPSNPDTIFVSYTDIGLWKSVDAGESWFYCDTGNHNAYAVVVDPTNSNKVWVSYGSVHDLPETKVLNTAPSGVGGIRYSTNGGTSWNATTGLPGRIVTDIVIDPTSTAGSRTMYASVFGGTTGGSYKSTDDGHSWTAINSGITGAGNSTNAWRINRGADGALYLVVMPTYAGLDGVIYKSTNGGTSWTAIKTTSQAMDYPLDIAIHPSDATILYICGYTDDRSGGVYKTTNGGTTWTRVLSMDHTHGINMMPGDPNTLYVGISQDDDFPTQRHIYYTRNAGSTWVEMSTIPFRACRNIFFNPSDANKMYVTTFGGGVQTNAFSIAQTYSISGYVRDAASLAVTGTTVTLSGSSSATTLVNASGYFEFTGLVSGNYTVAPSKNKYAFTPGNRTYLPLSTVMTSQDFTGVNMATQTISGYIKNSSSVAVSGVSVALSGQASSTTITDGNGYYLFTDLSTGTYTLIPTKTDFSFSPSSLTFTPLVTIKQNQNLTATYVGSSPQYMITGTILTSSGTVLEGITVALSGAENTTATTNSSGQYVFAFLYAGNYTVTPVQAGWVYSPAPRNYTLSADQSAQDYTATAVKYGISGQVVDSNSQPMASVTVTLVGATTTTVTTDATGLFEFTNLNAAGYTLTPAKTSYTFAPVNRVYTLLSATQTAQNFTGTLSVSTATYSISGYVRDSTNRVLSGITMAIEGAISSTTVTDSLGLYQFTHLSAGNYTIAPVAADLTFTPEEKVYTSLSANQTQDFTSASALTSSVKVLNNIFKPLAGEKTTVEFSNNTAGNVSIYVYSLNGDLITKILDNSYQTAGYHRVDWDGKNLGKYVPSGIYLVRIVAGSYKQMKKVCVIK